MDQGTKLDLSGEIKENHENPVIIRISLQADNSTQGFLISSSNTNHTLITFDLMNMMKSIILCLCNYYTFFMLWHK